jgi:hypothetical protein
MAWQNDLGVQALSAGKPRRRSRRVQTRGARRSRRCDAGIADTAMVLINIPLVQLKNQPAVRKEPLILTPAMAALAAKKTLVPATARLDIAHANEWLWIHTNLVA